MPYITPPYPGPPNFDVGLGLDFEDIGKPANPLNASVSPVIPPPSSGSSRSIDWASILAPIIGLAIGAKAGNPLLGFAAGTQFSVGRAAGETEREEARRKDTLLGKQLGTLDEKRSTNRATILKNAMDIAEEKGALAARSYYDGAFPNATQAEKDSAYKGFENIESLKVERDKQKADEVEKVRKTAAKEKTVERFEAGVLKARGLGLMPLATSDRTTGELNPLSQFQQIPESELSAIEKAKSEKLRRGPREPAEPRGIVVGRIDPNDKKYHRILIHPTTGKDIADLGVAPMPGKPGNVIDEEDEEENPLQGKVAGSKVPPPSMREATGEEIETLKRGVASRRAAGMSDEEIKNQIRAMASKQGVRMDDTIFKTYLGLQ